jgi:hypothetical protein
MAIARIPGYSLISDLDRQGTDLQFTTNGNTLVYMDFADFRLGVNTSTPTQTLEVNGNAKVGPLLFANTSISSSYGTVNFGSNANVIITGGTGNAILTTDGTGSLRWSAIGDIAATGGILGNNVQLGANTAGKLASNATSLTTTTTVTNGIALLNEVLGKLVPPAPPAFPNATSIAINSLSTYRMTNFTQTDNTANTRNVAAGSTVTSVRRAASYTTNTVSNVGPGDSGTVRVYLNNADAGNVALTGSSNGTYGNLIISANQDYRNVVANVAAGFWYSFSASAAGNVPAGWNEVNIWHTGVPAGTNTVGWYYDSSAPGTPTFFSTNIAILSASLTYSSTVPHYNSSTTANISFNVNRLSGDMYPTSDTFVTGTAGGAFAAPTGVTYATASVTTPLARNLYVSSGNATVATTTSIISGFGSSSSGPSVSVSNSYNTGTASFSPGATVLYKTGTSTVIEETSVVVTSVGTGSGNALRIINPGSADTPTYSSGASAFNSQTSTLQTYDATVVAAVLKHDQTNYATGYLPPGPNLSSGRSGAQYFTMKFTRTVVSKFDVTWTGNIAGLWVALPGSTIDSTSTLNGWVDLSTAYAGSGVPGANTGAGGNGSNGASLGGVAPLNSTQTNKSVTATFGTVSSSSTATNEIYIRIKLTSGQTVSALSFKAASN